MDDRSLNPQGAEGRTCDTGVVDETRRGISTMRERVKDHSLRMTFIVEAQPQNIRQLRTVTPVDLQRHITVAGEVQRGRLCGFDIELRRLQSQAQRPRSRRSS